MIRRVSDSELVSVPISNGGFVAGILEPDADWVVDFLELAGRRASAIDFRILSTETIAETGLDALWFSVPQFDVLDASTGEHLSGVIVEYSDNPSALYRYSVGNASFSRALEAGIFQLSGDTVPHRHAPALGPPDGTTPVLRDGVSPLIVDTTSSTGTYWFTAPGYEWRSWPSPESASTEVRLALVGSLGIELAGGVLGFRSRDLEVRVRDADGQIVFTYGSFDSTPIEVAGLVPGEYGVELVEFASSRIVDSQSTTVEAGLRSTVPLRVSGSPQELAMFTGSLFVEDRGRHLPSPTLTLISSDGARRRDLALQSIGESEFTWEAELIQPGAYSVELGPYPITWKIDAHELTRVDLHVRDLRERSVVVSANGRTATCASIAWRGDGDGLEFEPVPNTSPSDFRGPIPAGRVTFLVTTTESGSEYIDVDVVPGQDPVVLTSRQADRATLDIRVLEGAKAVSVTMEWATRVRVRDAEGSNVPAAVEWGWSGQGPPVVRLRVNTSGPIELVPPRLPGFPNLAEIWVTAVPRESVLVEWPIVE